MSIDKRKGLAELAAQVNAYRDEKKASRQPSASPTRKRGKSVPRRSKRTLGELEKLGSIFQIQSKRASYTYDFSTCCNCGNDKAHWTYAKTSVGLIHLCSKCKTTLSKKLVGIKSDAFFKVVNRTKRF